MAWIKIEDREPTKEGSYRVIQYVGSINPKLVECRRSFWINAEGIGRWSFQDWTHLIEWWEE